MILVPALRCGKPKQRAASRARVRGARNETRRLPRARLVAREAGMMRRLYSALMYLVMPFALAKLGWRGFANPAYWARIQERFGLGPPVSPRGDRGTVFWIHAVSVGEVQAAVPLVRRLVSRYPHARIVVSTTTPTGMERVRSALGTEVIHRYAPYDLPGATRRFLERVEPDLVVLIETELWPNIISRCHSAGIPIVLANARLSEQSAAGYRRIRPFMRRVLDQVSAIGAQSEEDGARLVDIGADGRKVRVIGSTKFDVGISPSVAEAGQVLRREWGVHRSVWIAASTHEGEEELVLDAFERVRETIQDCLLVLVPRHPERFSRAASLSRRRGYSVALRSQPNFESDEIPDVFVGDTMGELTVFYSASDVAFVGGSMVEVGGHNMLEPAALGVPMMFGPHLYNFAEISQRLCDAEAASIVADSTELGDAVLAYLQDANRRHSAGEQGRQFVARNRGACDRLMELIEETLTLTAAETQSGGPQAAVRGGTAKRPRE